MYTVPGPRHQLIWAHTPVMTFLLSFNAEEGASNYSQLVAPLLSPGNL